MCMGIDIGMGCRWEYMWEGGTANIPVELEAIPACTPSLRLRLWPELVTEAEAECDGEGEGFGD